MQLLHGLDQVPATLSTPPRMAADASPPPPPPYTPQLRWREGRKAYRIAWCLAQWCGSTMDRGNSHSTAARAVAWRPSRHGGGAARGDMASGECGSLTRAPDGTQTVRRAGAAVASVVSASACLHACVPACMCPDAAPARRRSVRSASRAVPHGQCGGWLPSMCVHSPDGARLNACGGGSVPARG